MADTMAVKFVDGSDDLIEGMLAPYGGPFAGKDFDGEYFSANTDFSLDWFGDWQRPLLYHHGTDSEIKTAVIGRIKVTPTEKGLWMQAQLDKAHEYHEVVAKLVGEGALGASSGSVAHLVHTDNKTGEIKAWPVIEGSLTPTPSNPDAKMAYSVKSADAVEHLAVIGTDAPEQIAEPEAVKTVEPEPEPIPALKAIQEALTPQSLHDAAVASGAKCAGETEHEPPVPLLAIAGKSTEQPESADLEALRADIRALAAAKVTELLAG